MSDKPFPLSLEFLIKKALHELHHKDSYFGIPSELFFDPSSPDHGSPVTATTIFGHKIHTPLGVAAGPHTQMAQNIIAAWLLGARYMELKTVQNLDDLEIPKPCIQMQDEGYNCEWSQELTIEQSYREYLHAWVGIHLINHYLGYEQGPGVVFNMSVGYDLQGIMAEKMQWFFHSMADASKDIVKCRDMLRGIYPAIDQVMIPGSLSDNVTLSTMHGCPASEIESIAAYLIQDKQLHTYVKLNPTLLGPKTLRDILNDKLGFQTQVPDQAFDHDLNYKDALHMIKKLTELARRENREFGLKLSNTLESVHQQDLFHKNIESMYMSGRALHPLTVNLAARLQQDFDGQLHVSFSGGADAFNFSRLVACGFSTITTCTDLLKPGGMTRLTQYIDHLASFQANQPSSTDPLHEDKRREQLKELQAYAKEVLEDKRYHRSYLSPPNIKTDRPLGLFDCISAPCQDTCATAQDIPRYIHHAARGDFVEAHRVVLQTNPFPKVTGMICDHLCQNKCTRMHYDDPLHIREIKRFVSHIPTPPDQPDKPTGQSVAIIGAGPAGLSCAWFMALAGFRVDVYESASRAGGMVRFAIPGFRLTHEAMDEDIARITGIGVKIHYNTKVDNKLFSKLRQASRFVFVATGAPHSTPLRIDGIHSEGVIDPLHFLFDTRGGKRPDIGKHVVIIGGGNTAMDAARTAIRLTGSDGSVKVVYRRTITEMPADQGEIRAALEEGIDMLELVAPLSVISKDGRVTGLSCARNRLGEADDSGRPKPVLVDKSGFTIHCDTIIPAIGQVVDTGFMDNDELQTFEDSHLTRQGNVYTGGDAMRGAATAIKAIGDGRKAALEMCREAGILPAFPLLEKENAPESRELMIRRAQRIYAPPIRERPPDQRNNFELVQAPLSEEEILKESSRCLHCDELCNTCVTVCPNLAMTAFTTEPETIPLYKAVRQDEDKVVIERDGVFRIGQKVQILNLADLCNHCGNCHTFCPASGTPHKDKANLHISLESFKNADEAYHLARLPGRTSLIYKHKEHIKTLTVHHDHLIYETDFVIARFEKPGFILSEARFLTPCVREASFKEAASMWIIMQGALQITV